jgi:L-rhamnose isomerase / sugar isomerase
MHVLSDATLAGWPIETAGWNYVSTGSRFATHANPGAARTIVEKIDDAALVHAVTGAAPRLAINTLVDLVDVDARVVRRHADSSGIQIGSVCPNLARDPRFRFGSLTHVDSDIRRQALGLVLDALRIAPELGADTLSLWLPDGAHYPGQHDQRGRMERLETGLAEIAEACVVQRLDFVLEYKLFEPYPWMTDIPDWGTALLLARRAGERVKVLVDLGHHAHGVNIPQIIATLAMEGRLGGFHLNDRLNADDDLTLGSINPYAIFLAFVETVDPRTGPCLLTLDQHHTAKPPVLATVQSVMRAQELLAKALRVDRIALQSAQAANDAFAAERVLEAAFWADVRPDLAGWRERRGLPADPIAHLLQSGLIEARNTERPS